MSRLSWLRRIVAVLIVLTAVLTSGAHRGGAPALADDTGDDEPAEEAADPAEVAIGERLFLETRFAQHFFVRSGGDVNAAVPSDPVMDETVTTGAPLPGPFAGLSMNCRSCHLVDEHGTVAGAGNRTYADFARRSPMPERADGERVTVRNAPPLVNASLRRRAFLLHFDGAFARVEDLVVETLLGRNFGWRPTERATARAHVARVIRKDDGTGDLAQEFGGAYRVVLGGNDPDIPPELRLPRRFRLDVARATDREIVAAVARLIAAYVRSLEFTRGDDGAFAASPYDVFLARNGLPRAPAPGESDAAYSRRLRSLLRQLRQPRWITPADGALRLHAQPFAFGPLELRGLQVFLAEPAALPLAARSIANGGIGNCLACHPAPAFTDFGLHNTGVAQSEYDAIHGRGRFAALFVPDLRARNAHVNAYLPATPGYPHARGPFRSVPRAGQPGLTDLGAWNVYAHPGLPRPQFRLHALLCERLLCPPDEVLTRALARFKTPGLRDLGHSGPYLHTGRADSLEAVLGLYAEFSGRARAGTMRNPAPELQGMALAGGDIAALAAFLRALNEDYE
jgi:Di-haem cytochrome c peroxidase